MNRHDASQVYTFLCGYRARVQGKHRVLANPSSDREWLRWVEGYDAADADLSAAGLSGEYRTVYTGVPRAPSRFELGEILEVTTHLEHGQTVARLFRPSSPVRWVGFSEGDSAFCMRRDNVCNAKVVEIGQLSGFARLVKVTAKPREAARSPMSACCGKPMTAEYVGREKTVYRCPCGKVQG